MRSQNEQNAVRASLCFRRHFFQLSCSLPLRSGGTRTVLLRSARFQANGSRRRSLSVCPFERTFRLLILMTLPKAGVQIKSPYYVLLAKRSYQITFVLYTNRVILQTCSFAVVFVSFALTVVTKATEGTSTLNHRQLLWY